MKDIRDLHLVEPISSGPDAGRRSARFRAVDEQGQHWRIYIPVEAYPLLLHSFEILRGERSAKQSDRLSQTRSTYANQPE